jgi:hypothetical protein
VNQLLAHSFALSIQIFKIKTSRLIELKTSCLPITAPREERWGLEDGPIPQSNQSCPEASPEFVRAANDFVNAARRCAPALRSRRGRASFL